MFWTVPLPADNAQVDLDRGTASYQLSNFALMDHHNVPNVLMGDKVPAVPATVSFEVRWAGGTRRTPVRDEKEQFTGEFAEATATAAWSSRQDGFSFTSDPASTSKSSFAAIGRERNGAFFAAPAPPVAAPPVAVPPIAAPAPQPSPVPVASPAPAPAAQVPRALPRTGGALDLAAAVAPVGATLALAGWLWRRRSAKRREPPDQT